MLGALYDEAAGEGNFGSPAKRPLEYSRVCVADPAQAGRGNCKHVRKDDYRIHTFAFAPKGWGVCDHIGKKVGEGGAWANCALRCVRWASCAGNMPRVSNVGHDSQERCPHHLFPLHLLLLQVAYVKAHVTGKHEFEEWGAVGH